MRPKKDGNEVRCSYTVDVAMVAVCAFIAALVLLLVSPLLLERLGRGHPRLVMLALPHVVVIELIGIYKARQYWRRSRASARDYLGRVVVAGGDPAGAASMRLAPWSWSFVGRRIALPSLLLGAFITYGVSAGLSLWAPEGTTAAVADREWEASVAARYGVVLDSIVGSRTGGMRLMRAGWQSGDRSVNTRGFVWHGYYEVWTGWPFLCGSYTERVDHGPGLAPKVSIESATSSVDGGILVPSWISARRLAGLPDRRIPVKLDPLPFVANTGVFGLLTYAVVMAAATFRWNLRIDRGRCPRCAYRILWRVDHPCPECGHVAKGGA